MKFVRNGCGVLAAAAALTGICFIVPTEQFLRAAQIMTGLTYLAGVYGGLRGAFAFAHGDRLRSAWIWLVMSGVVGVIETVWGAPLRSLPDLDQSTLEQIIKSVTDFFLNATTVIGLIIFTRAWTETGLVPPWQRRATFVAFAAGLVIAGPALWQDTHHVIHGRYASISRLLSDLGDMASMTLIGPLFASAVWMRGGALVGPYIYLTAYAFSWLLWDAGNHLPIGHAADFYDLFFAFSGNLFAAIAGLSHSAVIRRSHAQSAATAQPAN